MKTEFGPAEIHRIKGIAARLEQIPDEKWCINTLENEIGQRCVLGHINKMFGGEANSWPIETNRFLVFLSPIGNSAVINNTWEVKGYKSPKDAILKSIEKRLGMLENS